MNRAQFDRQDGSRNVRQNAGSVRHTIREMDKAGFRKDNVSYLQAAFNKPSVSQADVRLVQDEAKNDQGKECREMNGKILEERKRKI